VAAIRSRELEGEQLGGAASVIQVLFVVIAVVGLAAALGTILARNLVRAALYLIGFFFAVACVFVLLEAEFLAALQVLVYIGAVSILLMFGIMLTRNIQGDDPSSTPSVWKVPGLAAGLCVFLVLGYGISDQQGIGTQRSWSTQERRPPLQQVKEGAAATGRTRAVNQMAKVVGEELMKRFVIAFEVAGLLLTAAVVGAIAIAHREEGDPSASRSSQRSSLETSAPPNGAGSPALQTAGAGATEAHSHT
jgi:NADH:ubiquinone oxidoreductase subunit 6 (subunit J)